MITLTDGTASVQMPNPELGDSDQVNLRAKYKMTMDKKLHSYRRTPLTSKLLLQFTAMRATVYTSLVAFLKAAAGKTLTYTDYDGQIWRVVQTNTVNELIAARRGPLYDYTLELEGVNMSLMHILAEDSNFLLDEAGEPIMMESYL